MLKHIKNVRDYLTDGFAHIWSTPANQYYVRTLCRDMQPELAKRLPLYIVYVNNEFCFENYYRHRIDSEVFAIELILEGAMDFIQNDKKYKAEAGNVVLIHHGQNNEFATGNGGECHRLACVLSGHELNGLLITTKLIEQDVIKLNNFEIVKTTMCECFNELKEKKTGFRRRASILGYKLLLELEENLEQINIPELLSRALELMEHHVSQKMSTKEIADILNTTTITLNRLFKKYFKNTPINYFIYLKMETAKSLLGNKNIQIQEVAQSVGYSNSLYFSSEFKKRIGISPREFRKKRNS
ncbi:MAG: AraC family transcriptional regulator [Lentisphaeria bacterium]